MPFSRAAAFEQIAETKDCSNSAPITQVVISMSDEKPKASGMQKVAEEAFAPAAKEFGKEVAPLGKAAGALTNRIGQLLLKPFNGLIYGLEKAAEYIEKAVAERLKDVPQDKVVEPQPRIAVPAMQALTYSLDEEYIREMFANLIAADMNADTKADAHPAFVELIKEMTSLEARLLLALKRGDQIEGQVRFGTRRQFINHARTYSFTIEGVEIDRYPTALDNLVRLGLINFKEEYPTGFEAWIEESKEGAKLLFEEEMKVESNKAWAATIADAKGYLRCRGIYLTDLGRAFVNVCMKDLK
jgi:Abortive infection alpha